MPRLFLFTGLLFFHWQVFAQIEVPKGLTTQFGVDVPELGVSISPNNNSTPGPVLNFTPNVPGKTFISLGYGIFGGSVGWVGVQNPATSVQFGNTTSTDYQFRFYLRKWNLESFIQNYQGYYLNNTADVISNYNSNNPRILYPNLQTQHYGVIATYKFASDTFSASAAFDQIERQLSSGGSWLTNINFDYFSFSNPTSLVPSSVSSQYGGFQNLYAGNVLTTSAGFGYGYNGILLERWFMSGQAMLNIGPSYENYIYTTQNTATNSGINSLQVHVKVGLGYNGEKFTASARVNFDQEVSPLPSVNLSYGAAEIALYVGYRWTEVDFAWLDSWQDKLWQN